MSLNQQSRPVPRRYDTLLWVLLVFVCINLVTRLALLAFEGDEAVGLVVYFFEFSTWRGRPGVYVQDLYVAPRMRGRGLGRDLMDAVGKRSRERGGNYVKLSVYDGNEQAIGFYRTLGFEVCDDEQVLALRE